MGPHNDVQAGGHSLFIFLNPLIDLRMDYPLLRQIFINRFLSNLKKGRSSTEFGIIF